MNELNTTLCIPNFYIQINNQDDYDKIKNYVATVWANTLRAELIDRLRNSLSNISVDIFPIVLSITDLVESDFIYADKDRPFDKLFSTNNPTVQPLASWLYDNYTEFGNNKD
jgi:hypothetical protein